MVLSCSVIPILLHILSLLWIGALYLCAGRNLHGYISSALVTGASLSLLLKPSGQFLFSFACSGNGAECHDVMQ